MITVTEHLRTQPEFRLTHGLMVYQSTNESRVAVMAHKFRYPSTGPELMEGVPLDMQALEDLLMVAKNGSSYLPAEVLSLTSGCMVWWMPSCVRQLWFAPNSSGEEKVAKKLNGESFTQPALVFYAKSNTELRVWSLRHNKRPTPETKLCQAPYYNVFSDSKVCRGNANFPNELKPSSMAGFEEAFFDSNFTHNALNVGGVKRSLTRHPGGHWGLWQEMRGKRLKPFPSKYLTSLPMTLGAILNPAFK